MPQKLSDYDAKKVGTSSTVTSSAALCRGCNKWFPVRYMFWDNEPKCKDCISG